MEEKEWEWEWTVVVALPLLSGAVGALSETVRVILDSSNYISMAPRSHIRLHIRHTMKSIETLLSSSHYLQHNLALSSISEAVGSETATKLCPENANLYNDAKHLASFCIRRYSYLR